MSDEIRGESTQSGEAGRGARESSLTLRQVEAQDASGAALDPANQSLADALRITFKALMLTIILLAGAFVLSGFQSVREGERGIALLFGKVTARNLSPGFRFSFPFPFGELIRVSTSVPHIRLDDEFWPSLSEQERRQSIENLPPRPSLNPAHDNSLITADQAIAHMRWTVAYRRPDIEAYARNILPSAEVEIVKAAVKRGVIQATATTPIEVILQQASGDEGSVADRARRVAQAMLDRMESGLVIEQLNLDEKMPPVRVRDAFARVQSADAERSKRREQAVGEANRTLNAIAGSAAPVLTKLIDDYEAALRDPLTPAGHADVILTRINHVLEGRETEVDGQRVVGLASGEVTGIIEEARRYRNNIVDQRRAEAATFKAKLEQYRANPLVVVHREWTEGLRMFMDRQNVQVMLMPPGEAEDRMTMVLNLDPDILKEQQRFVQEERNRRAAQERLRRLDDQQFRTDTTRTETSH